MNDKLQVAIVPEDKTAAPAIDRDAILQDIVAQVRSDSVSESEKYLDETTVPHGGE